MTLNITAVSNYGVYQSTDLRLLNIDTHQVIDDSSPKQINIIEGSSKSTPFNGFISYCGIGRWQNKDTSDWLMEWLSERNGRAPIRFNKLVDIIQKQGSTWLATMPRFYRHSFVVAAISNEHPLLALVSNFERLNGVQKPMPEKELFIEQIRPNSPFVLVTGLRKAVNSDDKKQIESLLSARSDPTSIRQFISEVNVRAHASKEANNGISKSCLVSSMLPNGDGASEIYGDVKKGFLPLRIINGSEISQSMFNIALQISKNNPQP